MYELIIGHRNVIACCSQNFNKPPLLFKINGIPNKITKQLLETCFIFILQLLDYKLLN